MILNKGVRVTQRHQKWYHSIDRLWLPIVTIALSGVFSAITVISVEECKSFPLPLYFAPLLKGFPLELCTGAGVKNTRMMGLPDRERSLTISSAVWIQYTIVIEGRTDTGRHQTPRLSIASHGKNGNCFIISRCHVNWFRRHCWWMLICHWRQRIAALQYRCTSISAFLTSPVAMSQHF